MAEDFEGTESEERPAAKEEEKPAETGGKDDASDEEEQEEDSEEEEAEADDEDEDEETEEVDDPELKKRIAAIQRAEKRSRRALDKERDAMRAEFARAREDLDRERQQWTPALQRAQRFMELENRVSANPVAVMRALGLPESRYEDVSKQFYYLSKGIKDPKFGELAAREQRALETSDEVMALRQELQEIKQERAQERVMAQQQRDAAEYIDTVASAITEDTPIVARMFESNRSKTLDRLRAIAAELIEVTGEVPEPEEVTRALEESRRKDLEEAGVDVATVVKRKKSKDKTGKANEKKTALSSNLGKPTQPRSTPRTPEEIRAQTLRDLENGALD